MKERNKNNLAKILTWARIDASLASSSPDMRRENWLIISRNDTA